MSENLGACCICETTEGVTAILMLDRFAPVPGHGWGCAVCGLPAEGAVAVLCDKCADSRLNGGVELRFVCRGYPAIDGRIPYGELSPEVFEHDRAKHAADEGMQSYSPEEIEAALKIGSEIIRPRINAAMVAGAAEAAEYPDHIFRAAVHTEMMLLAAFMYSGDLDSFMNAARRAFDAAREHETTNGSGSDRPVPGDG